MKIWLVTIGEPLPTDGPNERLLRTGILAETLGRNGHQVIWWTSDFDHVRKQRRTAPTATDIAKLGYEVKHLHGVSYGGNVSLRRMLNHRMVATDFRKQTSSEETPDVIMCSWPLIELCAEAVRYGNTAGVPVVLDIRDMWPDAIVDLAPQFVRWAARLAFRSAYRTAREAASQAAGIMGITEDVVDWGIQFAGRQRSPTDRAFPMGYRAPSFSAGSLDDAAAYWHNLGLRADGSEFIACFFGAIGRHFEFETVVEAARRLSRQRRPVKFVLCGDGPSLPRWKKLAADCPNILLPGWVDGARIHTLMGLSSVGLAPYYSSWDFRLSIPNKPIEYMSASLPVVSSLQGVLADLLRENHCGVTYTNGDSNDLVRHLSHCYDNPSQLEKMGKNAERVFRNRFTAEAVYAQMQDFLSKIANNPLPGQAV